MLRLSCIGDLLRKVLPPPLRWSTFCPWYLRRLVVRRSALRVMAGPFRGLHYIDESHHSVLEPKLLGLYEREIQSIIERSCSLAYRKIVVIGAAEGYYSVGMAVRHRHAQVVAFELDADARALMRRMAARNRVLDRVQILGECTTELLEQVLKDAGPILIICDVEGAEMELLDPNYVPSLARCEIIAELHRSRHPNIEEIVASRFAATHQIRRFPQEARSAIDFPISTLITRCIPRVYLDLVVSEFRQPWEPPMSWLWLDPVEN